MKNKIALSFLTTTLLAISSLQAESARDIVTDFNKCKQKAPSKSADNLEEMFSQGEVCGQIRLGYLSYDKAVANTNDQRAAAIAGRLKFRTASLNGISVAAAMFASQDIRAISGDPAQNKYTDALSSVERKYTELAQAYINYDNNGLNIRLGRQVIDTPLADSDDIWMTPNTFEAYMASYELGDAGLTFTVGNLQRWQGADAATSSTHPTNPDTAYANVINNSWSETGDDGTWLGSLQFENETLALSAWYYDISKSQAINVANKSTYVDGAYTFTIAEGKSFTLGAQYLTQSESDASGVDGSISGVIAEVALDSLVFGGAYNKAKVGNGKSLFEGFGGGASYTNMHNLTAGTFHDGSTGGGSSYVLGAEYTPNDFSFIAAYGTFKADNLSTTATGKQHATELDLGVNYAYNDGKIEASLFYIIGEDKESAAKTDYDDDYVQLTLNYNF